MWRVCRNRSDGAPRCRLEASDGFRLWLTADADRLPVKIEAPVKFFGSLKAQLSEYEPGRLAR